MCDWGDTVELDVLIHKEDSHTGAARWAIKPIDRCVAPVVKALTEAGIYTRSACCGHHKHEGVIRLHDGRTLWVSEGLRFKDISLRRRLEIWWLNKFRTKEGFS